MICLHLLVSLVSWNVLIGHGNTEVVEVPTFTERPSEGMLSGSAGCTSTLSELLRSPGFNLDADIRCPTAIALEIHTSPVKRSKETDQWHAVYDKYLQENEMYPSLGGMESLERSAW